MKLDAYQLAMLPVAFLTGQDEPFDRYRNESASLSDAYRDVVNTGVWAYQLHTYLALVRARFGGEVQRIVREYQLIILDREEGAGDVISKTYTLIEGAVGSHLVEIPTRQGPIEVPVEMNVALSLLLDIRESPHYVANPALRDAQVNHIEAEADWNFASCLACGRDEIVATFSPMLENISLSKESVKGLEYPE